MFFPLIQLAANEMTRRHALATYTWQKRITIINHGVIPLCGCVLQHRPLILEWLRVSITMAVHILQTHSTYLHGRADALPQVHVRNMLHQLLRLGLQDQLVAVAPGETIFTAKIARGCHSYVTLLCGSCIRRLPDGPCLLPRRRPRDCYTVTASLAQLLGSY
jgi:hypothetical protein